MRESDRSVSLGMDAWRGRLPPVPLLMDANMERLTYEEARKRQERMREYFREGHSRKETATKFNTSVDYVKRICRGARGYTEGNQYTGSDFDRVANAIRHINERTPQFEYAGNYTGVDGYADIRCKTCGTVTRKSFVAIRHGTAICEVCRHTEIEERRQRAERQRRAEQESRAARVRYNKIKRTAYQISMKQCPICGALFSADKIYCSVKCRNQNKYNLKDGYRHLYPLEEVYKRDKGVCYICGGKCDWNDLEERNGVVVYGNLYPSRDHVVPKSKGGANSWENIRLAHRICNSLKADSPLVKI